MAATSLPLSTPFERRLFSAGPPDEALFPTLKRIALLPNLPERLHGLTFPELLVESGPQTTRLDRTIEELERWRSLDPACDQLRESYLDYRRRVLNSEGKAQEELIHGQIRLLIRLNGQLSCLLFDRKGVKSSSIKSQYRLGIGSLFFAKNLNQHPEIDTRESGGLSFESLYQLIQFQKMTPLPLFFVIGKERPLSNDPYLTNGARPLNLGVEHLFSDRPQIALDLFSSALKQLNDQRHPDTLEGLIGLGDTHIKLGNFEEAIQQYDKALSLSIELGHQGKPQLATIFIKISNAQNYLGEFDQAERFLERAKEIYRNHSLDLSEIILEQEGEALSLRLADRLHRGKANLETGEEGLTPLPASEKERFKSALAARRDGEVRELLIPFFEKVPSDPLVHDEREGLSEEGVASRAFERAYLRKERFEMVFWLEKLAQIYLEKEEWLTTSKLLNSALILAENPTYCELTLSRLEELERRLLFKISGRQPPLPPTNTVLKHRVTLGWLREMARQTALNGSSKIYISFSHLANSYKTVLRILIYESIELLGPAPTPFLVVGLGSLAREEASLYSDIEYAFLIQDSSPAHLSYFRQLDQLLSLKMVNIGESDFPLLQRVEEEKKSLTPKGFSPDIGGICPSGKRGIYELIGTPEELARFQREEWLNEHDSELILVNAMRIATPIFGDRRLLFAYETNVKNILDQRARRSVGAPPLLERQLRALTLIEAAVQEFKPRLDYQKVKIHAFDVKKEFYRPLQSIIQALALYYGIDSKTSRSQIEQLANLELISEEGANHLDDLLETILFLRLQTHHFYKREREVLYFPRKGERDPSLFSMKKSATSLLISIYETLIPLYHAAEAFLQGDRSAFQNNSFNQILPVDQPYLAQAETACALSPFNSFFRKKLGKAQESEGEYRRALKNLSESLRILEEEEGDEASKKRVGLLTKIGACYLHLGEFSRSREFLNRAIEMGKKLEEMGLPPSKSGHLYAAFFLAAALYSQGESRESIELLKPLLPHLSEGSTEKGNVLHFLGLSYIKIGKLERAEALFNRAELIQSLSKKKIIGFKNDLALLALSQGKYERANQLFNEALQRSEDFYQDRFNPLKVDIISNISVIHIKRGEFPRAIELLEEAATLFERSRTQKTVPEEISLLGNLGVAYRAIERFEEAIAKFERCLALHRSIDHGEPSSDLANTWLNLGQSYQKTGQLDRAVAPLLSALELFRHFSDLDGVAATLSTLGAVLSERGEAEKGVGHLEESIKIYKIIHSNQPHPSLISTLIGLGNCYRRLKRFEEAITSYNQSLNLCNQFELYPNWNSAANFIGLGNVYYEQKRWGEALDSYQSALTILRQIYRNRPIHRLIAQTLNNIGAANLQMGRFEAGLPYLEEALELFNRNFGPDDPDTQKIRRVIESLRGLAPQPAPTKSWCTIS